MTRKQEDTSKLAERFDLPDLIMSATAYYLGRMTIQMHAFVEDLIASWDELPAGVKRYIIRIVDEEFERDSFCRQAYMEGRRESDSFPLGTDIDRAIWAELRSIWSDDLRASSENSKQPVPISEGMKTNFATVQAAATNGDLMLVSAIRVTGEDAVLLCAANRLSDGSVASVPLAEMIQTDPYRTYLPPATMLDTGKLQTENTAGNN